MFKEYLFADGYVVYVRGFSKRELRAEEQKHGKLQAIRQA